MAEIDTVTSSYSRKVNHALYGGGNYESSDHFVSMTATLEPNEDPIQAEKGLHQTCKEMVTNHVLEEITTFSGGVQTEQFYTYLRDLVARRPIDGEVYYKCNKMQQDILQAAKKGIQMNKRDVAKDDITIEPTE